MFQKWCFLSTGNVTYSPPGNHLRPAGNDMVARRASFVSRTFGYRGGVNPGELPAPGSFAEQGRIGELKIGIEVTPRNDPGLGQACVVGADCAGRIQFAAQHQGHEAHQVGL